MSTLILVIWTKVTSQLLSSVHNKFYINSFFSPLFNFLELYSLFLRQKEEQAEDSNRQTNSVALSSQANYTD
jgi:hypothetical protein